MPTRLIAVDEKGHEITGDQILMICAKAAKDEGRLKSDLLVSTVMSNLGLTVACKRYGFRHRASKVGDRYVLEVHLQRLGSAVGVRTRATIFLDYHTTGDGILTAITASPGDGQFRKPLSELAQVMDVYPQKLLNVAVSNRPISPRCPRSSTPSPR